MVLTVSHYLEAIIILSHRIKGIFTWMLFSNNMHFFTYLNTLILYSITSSDCRQKRDRNSTPKISQTIILMYLRMNHTIGGLRDFFGFSIKLSLPFTVTCRFLYPQVVDAHLLHTSILEKLITKTSDKNGSFTVYGTIVKRRYETSIN